MTFDWMKIPYSLLTLFIVVNYGLLLGAFIQKIGARAGRRYGIPVFATRDINTAAGLAQPEVHATRLVREYPVAQQPLRHARDLRLAVAGLDAHQRQQAGADRPHGGAVDGHVGAGDALDQGEHAGLRGCGRQG